MDSGDKVGVAAPIVPIAPADARTAANDGAELLMWQEKLRPLMSVVLVALGLAFFALSVWDFLQVRDFILAGRSTGVRADAIARLAPAATALTEDQRVRESLLVFEADAIDKRYQQASALLMSRIWEKHMAFLTGMVLALLGATFVLGRLREARSTLSGGTAQWKAEVSSASPGIILAFLGAVLLVASLLVHVPIDVRDTPIYFHPEIVHAEIGAESPAPVTETPMEKPIDIFKLPGASPTAKKAKP